MGFYISKPEAEFWFGAKSKGNIPEKLKGFYQFADASVSPYIKAGKVKTFDYGQELFPGIMPLARPGHTPGHTFYVLSSKGEKLVFWGDVIHSAASYLGVSRETLSRLYKAQVILQKGRRYHHIHRLRTLRQ